MKFNNHLGAGAVEVTFKNKKVTSSINSARFAESLKNLDSLSRSVGVIPPGFEHRADLIADLFYGSPALDWMVL